ncbi:hypothetical protein HYH03_011453 [Edaphochlamys debaryana]|uniref:Glycosyltransferase 2-like domain-containing protein n=1 Tax=Edaphochlamys debaryana TaxID=47281 RepID=A0A836BWI4_9CHLO|nr:hypothetical protein HYH03_011453 [Edaphochlamys debaryana]|eukprot:KAG2490149.1 hypothetical protein HYH03_011453 [Edaphochlamys debaryana]
MALMCKSHRLRGHRPLSGPSQPMGASPSPVWSVMVNYFKRPFALDLIVDSLLRPCQNRGLACEVIVNVDNPHEAGMWARQTTKWGGSLLPIFSANLHESRGYNRAAKAAKGKILIIWQDDQTGPGDAAWMLDLAKLYDTYPQIGIIGMNTYRLCRNFEPTNRWGSPSWEPDPRTGVRWTYAQMVDFAPFVVRSELYHELGGLDEGLSKPGECGIWGDWEMSSRSWMAGWQVGFYNLEGRGNDGHPGGTHSYVSGEKCWGRQQHVASFSFGKRFDYGELNDEMCNRVWELNMGAFTISNWQDCPYRREETNWGNCTRAGSPEYPDWPPPSPSEPAPVP